MNSTYVITSERLICVALLDNRETIFASDALVFCTSPCSLLPALPRCPLTRVLFALGCVVLPLILYVCQQLFMCEDEGE
jgi:hypothetical protein